MIQDLESREDLLSLCYIPMNCAVIIFVYKGENFHLPSTVTALYKLYSIHTLRRYASKRDLQEDFGDFEDLPNELECKFVALAEIAYRFLIEDKFVFKQSDLGPNREARTQLQIMGLVTSFSVSSGSGHTQCFQFLHLTVQEFLAAWHASTLPDEKQAEIIGDFSNSQLKLMRYFLAGINKLQAQKVFEAFYLSFEKSLMLEKDKTFNVAKRGYKYFYTGVNRGDMEFHGSTEEVKVEVSYNCNLVIEHLHMIYEAQRPEVCECVSKAFDEKAVHFNKSPYQTETGNYFLNKVLFFFLSSSSCDWKRVQTTPDVYSHAQIFFLTKPFSVKTLIMNSDDPTCHFTSKKLDIYEVSPLHTVSTQQLLLQAPLRLSETLQELSLELSYCDPEVMAHFGCGLEVSNIRTLTLFMGCYRDFGEATVRLAEARSYEKITQEMMVLLLPYIAKLKFLEHLQLGTVNIINDRDEQYSVSNDADDAFKPLYTMLKSTRTLKTLGLHSTNFMSLGIHHLCSGLQENSTLTGLSVTSFHSCNLFTLLDFVRIENLSLEAFRLNELGKLCSKIFSKYNTMFQEVIITAHVCKFMYAGVDLIKLQVIRKSNSVNLQKVCLEWDHLLSVNDVISILHNLKDNCQYLRNISIKGSLASDTKTAKDAGLVEHCAQNSKCEIGDLFAHFLLNSECTFDFQRLLTNTPLNSI